LSKTKKIKKRKQARSPLNIIAPLAVLVLIVAALEILTRSLGISREVLPPPSQVVLKTADAFPTLLPHILFTLQVILIGYIIAVPIGMLLAALFSQFNLLTQAFSPVIIWLVITPMITLIPLLILWLGTDPNIRIIVVAIQAMPIITLNTLNGFKNVENDKLELARSVGATKFQAFKKIVFMNAMPQVFTGLKLGCIFSTIGAISADFVAYGKGLGYMILQNTKYVNTEIVYGCIIIIAIIGISLYTIVQAIEHRVVLWKK
jgi:ABC-type nitrate/sulfonate/bicarbonate transport system permease component